MEWDDKVQRSQAICRRTGQPIADGAVVHSALMLRDGRFERWDFSPEGWTGTDGLENLPTPPPAGTGPTAEAAAPAVPADPPATAPARLISWWKHRRPEAETQRGPRMVGKTILLGIFHDLKDSPERPRQCFAWMLALLLVRLRAFRFLDLRRDGDRSWLVIEEKDGAGALRIRDPEMTPAEQAVVEADFQRIFEVDAGG